jgi:type II secretory pathway component PulM
MEKWIEAWKQFMRDAAVWLREHPRERFRIAVGSAILCGVILIVVLFAIFHHPPVVGKETPPATPAALSLDEQLQQYVRTANLLNSKNQLTDQDLQTVADIRKALIAVKARFKDGEKEPTGPQRQKMQELESLLRGLGAM